MEAVTAVVVVVLRREGEAAYKRTEGFGRVSWRQLCNALQPLTVAAERARSYSEAQILTIKSL